MTPDTKRDFLERYEDLEDHQILALHRRREDLIAEARAALDETMDQRGLDKNAPAPAESEEESAQRLRDSVLARLCSLGLAALVCLPLAWGLNKWAVALGAIPIAFIVVAAALLGQRIGIQIVRRISERSDVPLPRREQSLRLMLAGEAIAGLVIATFLYALR
ncbi:MAG: hypothetical protein QM803_13650 [Rhodocyclaceae bacterium]